MSSVRRGCDLRATRKIIATFLKGMGEEDRAIDLHFRQTKSMLFFKIFQPNNHLVRKKCVVPAISRERAPRPVKCPNTQCVSRFFHWRSPRVSGIADTQHVTI